MNFWKIYFLLDVDLRLTQMANYLNGGGVCWCRVREEVREAYCIVAFQSSLQLSISYMDKQIAYFFLEAWEKGMCYAYAAGRGYFT